MLLPDALATAFDAPPLPQHPQAPPPGTVCAMTGTPITTGYPLTAILAEATADIVSTFPYRSVSAYVSEATARAFKQRLAGNLIAYEAQGWHGERPMVSRESATLGHRSCWSALVRRLIPGTPTVAIFSADVQRRLWPNAALSPVGPAWRVYLHSGGVSRGLTIDHTHLLACLDCMETWYTAGISKDALQRGLFGLSGGAALKSLGWATCRTAENALAPWRSDPAFPVALFIAQKAAVALTVTPQKEEKSCPSQAA